ncbi:MAG TPA: nucleotidyl transferase AbiEii/AbiGii toxin family protein [Thermoanaerobaculia bacterium]|nr:nucleotidyl transferase AbiEii/AbiGii toxin family protein [Thermoanaerobaculia bacterium]HQN07369.1 nucleotidyl transferase AbiEii/AbiGii toxin family protein [Thermoanaerobaculia bacterium]HQP85412.1 nucleotidyl transferase AbiEii/AbiGii toxin family protein [Thermoanaerobaculia bacterium]
MADTSRLPEAQRRALDRLKSVPRMADFYLAGGTAVAVHLGHRLSLDLDFFSVRPDADLDAVRDSVRHAFAEASTVAQTDTAVQLLCDGAPIDLVRYPYPPLRAIEQTADGVAVASLLDLAAMKLGALSRRGLRRDFWDLAEIVRRGGVSLEEACRAYRERYGVAEADLYHVLRSLAWFEDAERDPMYPAGLTEAGWRDIQAFFLREAPKLLTASFG